MNVNLYKLVRSHDQHGRHAYGKNLKKSSPEPVDRLPCNLVCNIVYASTAKIVQIITLG